MTRRNSIARLLPRNCRKGPDLRPMENGVPFPGRRKSVTAGQSGGGLQSEGSGEVSEGEISSADGGTAGPPDISFGSGPTGKWSSVAESVRKGFAGRWDVPGSGTGAGSDIAGGEGNGSDGADSGSGSQTEELAALTPSGPPIFFPLPKFKYLDVRNKKLERTVELTVTLDVVGEEELDMVEEKAEDIHAVLDKELSRIVSKAGRDEDSFAISFLKKRFLMVCNRELGEGVVRGILVQDSKEARSSR